MQVQRSVLNYPKPSTFYSCTNEDSLDDNPSDFSCFNSVGSSFQVFLTNEDLNGGYEETLTGRCIVNDSYPESGILDSSSSPHSLRLPVFFPTTPGPKWGVRVYSDTGCSDLSSQTIFTHPYAGEYEGNGGRMTSNLAAPANKFVVLTPVCSSSAGQNTTPFESSDVESGDVVRVLCNADQIANYIPTDASTMGEVYQVMSDITFNSNTYPESVIAGDFTGKFDGGGHLISDVTISSTTGTSGFFATVTGTVKNAHFKNISLDCTVGAVYNVGGLVGQLTGSLENIVASDFQFSNDGCGYAGGVIGTVSGDGTLDNIYKLKVQNMTYTINSGSGSIIGGAIGLIDSTSYVDGIEVSGLNYNVASTPLTYITGGGVIGKVDGSSNVENIYAENVQIGNSVTYASGHTNFGGAVGYLSSSQTLKNSKLSGSIFMDGDTTSSIGGVVGFVSGGSFVEDAIFDGEIHSTTHKRVGGVAGKVESSSSIMYAQSYGSLYCSNNCGGIVGSLAESYLYESYSDMFITSEDSVATAVNRFGGIVGDSSDSTINGAQFDGTIDLISYTSASRLGGIVGDVTAAGASDNNITGVVTHGNVLSAGTYVGGLGGYIDPAGEANITLSYAVVTGNVSGTSDVYLDFGLVNSGANILSLSSCWWTDTFSTGLGASDCAEAASGVFSFSSYDSGFSSVYDTNSNYFQWADGDAVSEMVELSFVRGLKDLNGRGVLGNDSDPFIITSASQWNSISDNYLLMEKTFELGANISFSSEASFEPIGSYLSPFGGHFFGRGYTISDITETLSDEYFGLFGMISFGGGINNFDDDADWDVVMGPTERLYLNNVNLTYSGSNDYYGGLVAGLVSNADGVFNIEISNSSVSASGGAAIGNLGGAIGEVLMDDSNATYIENIYLNEVTVYDADAATAYVGGAFGQVYFGGSVADNIEYKTIRISNPIVTSATGIAGGMAGKVSNTLSNEVNFETVYVLGESTNIQGYSYAGGIVGYFQGRVMLNNTAIRGGFVQGTDSSSYAGGLIGYQIYSSGTYTDDGDETNDDVGKIRRSYAETSVTAGSYAGCLMGYLEYGNTFYIGNAYANCTAVTGTGVVSKLIPGTTPYMDVTSTFYISDSDLVITDYGGSSVVNLSLAQISDESYMQASYPNFEMGDPWLWTDGDVPREVFEVYPEYFFQ